ncbi:MAG: C25 family cysteine peptidase [Armatimonadota bacterium]|nr:C25 family cysteine peptidase [bacterium]
MIHRLAIAAALLCACGTCMFAGSVEIDLDVPDISLPQPQAGISALSSRTPQRIERLAISGYSSYSSSGNPAIPCKTIYVALPPEADEYSVEVVTGSYSTTVLEGAYDIAPVPPAAVSKDYEEYYGEDKIIVNGRNTLVYSADEYYPEDYLTVCEVGRLRNWKIIALEFWPYSYNPVTGKLRKVQLNHATLSYSASPYRCVCTADPVAADMAGFVGNKSEALDYYCVSSAAVAASAATYVIITTNEIASASASLAHFKTFLESRGFNVLIATESDWGGGTGDVAADNIREWLASNYIELGIEYVLLVGNPNPASGDVPMKMLWPRYSQASYRDAPSDYYYSDLTGDWDLDGDGIYGEQPDDFGTGGIDRIPDVYVGRIPYYGSITDLDEIFQKTINYQTSMLGDWSRRFIFAMKPLDSATPCYQLGESIIGNISDPLGFNHDRIYNASYSLSPEPEHYPCTMDTVQAEWSAGAGLVFYMTHGSSTSASYVMSSGSCSNLGNNTPSIVYGAACENGKPEQTNNLGYALLRDGAVSTLTASRVSWYYIGESDFTCSDSIGGLGYQYAKYLLSGEESCARAIMDARLSVPMYIWANQLVFNLYGDPSLVFNTTTFGGVSGKVMDQDDSPIAEAQVRSADGARSVKTQADGSYRLSGFNAKSLDVIVSAPGYYSQRFYGLPIVLGSDTQIDFYLVPAITGTIAGFVCDIYGAPIQDAEVSTVDGRFVTYSASDGSYTIDGLEPGEYTLLATCSPYAQKMVSGCAVTSGDVSRVDIYLHLNSANTVLNGGFEGGFTSNVGNQWKKYSVNDYFGTAMAGSDQRKYGSYSQKIRLAQPTVESYAGFYQVVTTLPGQTYSLTAWARDYFSGSEDSTSKNVVCRLGWDISGGIDPLSSSIVWKQFDPAHKVWHALFSDATAKGLSMTIFLEAVRKLPSGGDDCYAWFDGVSLTGPVESPAVPIVAVNDSFCADSTSITASWTCSSADIAYYEYAVSATDDDSGIVPGGEWLSVGTDVEATRFGLVLANGDCVRILVRATNAFGVTGEIGMSEPVRIVKEVESISAAKLLADGVWVHIAGVKTTRMGEGASCFVEEPDRRSGIDAKSEWLDMPYMQLGTMTDIVGCMTSEDGMRVISQAEFEPSLVVDAPKPLGMPNKFVGGGSFFVSEGGHMIGQAGSSWGSGLNNVGLLVSVWGKITENDSSGFILNDGSLPDGIYVSCFNDAIPPDVDRAVRVTGIATPWGVSVYDSGDIIVLN